MFIIERDQVEKIFIPIVDTDLTARTPVNTVLDAAFESAALARTAPTTDYLRYLPPWLEDVLHRESPTCALWMPEEENVRKGGR